MSPRTMARRTPPRGAPATGTRQLSIEQLETYERQRAAEVIAPTVVLAGELAGDPFLNDLMPFATRVAFAGCVNSLAQTAALVGDRISYGKMSIFTGSEDRTIVAGIGTKYTPEELVAFRHGGILPYVVRQLVART